MLHCIMINSCNVNYLFVIYHKDLVKINFKTNSQLNQINFYFYVFFCISLKSTLLLILEHVTNSFQVSF